MTEPCTIRRAIAEDASAIRAVADASWQAAYSDFLDDEEIQSALDDWYDVERLEQSLEDPNHPYFIAEVDGEVRGYASVNCTDSTVVKLSSIYTHPDWWGEGYGSALLDRTLTHARENGAERIELVVDAENEIGQSFYESNQFECVGREDATDHGGENDLLRYARSIS